MTHDESESLLKDSRPMLMRAEVNLNNSTFAVSPWPAHTERLKELCVC